MGWMKYKVNLNYFSEPNAENSYWAGFIAADGCIDKKTGALRIRLKASDRPHLERFCRDVQYNGRIYDCTSTVKGKTYLQVQICISNGKIWANDLYKHWNITPAKSLTLEPPNITDPDLIKCFIIGYFDGDGHVHKIQLKSSTSWHLSFAGTKLMLNWIKMNCEYWYQDPNSRSQVNESKIGNWYDYQVNGRKAELMVQDLNKYDLPRLTRKWDESKISTFTYPA